MPRVEFVTEEIRRSCVELEMRHPNARSLMLTGPAGGEGTSTITALYGRMLAEMNGSSVVIVDTDLRSASLHRKFSIRMEGGLRDWEPKSPGSTVHRTVNCRQLSVMPAGTDNGSTLYTLHHSGKLDQLATWLKQEFTFVLWDTPPLMLRPDGRFLLPFVDGVLIVAESDATRLEALGDLCGDLAASSARLFGVIINRSGRYSTTTHSASRALRRASP